MLLSPAGLGGPLVTAFILGPLPKCMRIKNLVAFAWACDVRFGGLESHRRDFRYEEGRGIWLHELTLEGRGGISQPLSSEMLRRAHWSLRFAVKPDAASWHNTGALDLGILWEF